MSRFRRSLLRYAAAAGWVALSTAAAEVLFRLTQNTRLSMVFLAGVLLTAFFNGSGPAYLAAILAFFVYNFYLVEPRFSVSFEAEDVINLVVFLGVAMLTGSLTGRVRDQAARAERRAQATDILLRATREFSSLSDEAAIRETLARRLAAACNGAAVVFDGSHRVSAPDAFAPPPELMTALAPDNPPGDAPLTRAAGAWTLRPLRSGDQSLGVAAWREDGRRLGEDERRILDILADSGAAAMDRARLAAAKAEAETRARTEDLRNALLSSISHDLRTPLAAILASATSLQQFGEAFDLAVRRDLAATIQEEAERMDAFVANLLNMTRLEAGALAIQKSRFSVLEAVSRIAQRRGRGRLALDPPPGDLPDALGDAVLFEQALENVVENALRYTPREAPIRVAARAEGGRVVVEVVDAGPGVSPGDLSRIFEKFYRAPENAHRAGTGLGLSIARGLLEAMDGAIEACNRAEAPDGATGLRMTISLEQA